MGRGVRDYVVFARIGDRLVRQKTRERVRGKRADFIVNEEGECPNDGEGSFLTNRTGEH